MNSTHCIQAACLLLIVMSGCSRPEGKPGTAAPEAPLFEKVAVSSSGMDFKNTLAPETFERNIYTFNYLYNGGGVATGDINNDGLPDVFFTGNDVPNRLYLNKGDMQFEDVTEKAGILAPKGWNAGVQMVDINADGWLDIYVCRGDFEQDDERNRNLLYINQQDGTFSEEAEKYSIADPGFSIDAVFFDADNDGDLDLYVTNRPGAFFLDLNKITQRRPIRDVREEDQFYRNEGNGRFSRVTREAGITNNFGFGLSATAADINGDGFQDIYVSNDFLESDYLYVNQGDGTFREESKKYLGHVPFYSMGTDIMDFNNDGWEDMFTSEMLPEDYKRSKTSMAAMNVLEFNMLIDYGMHHQYMHNALQLNRGNGYFTEIAQLAGVHHTDWSWATFIADFDNDGLRDLFVANGYKRDVYDNDAMTKMRAWEMENMDKPRTSERLNEYLNLLPGNAQVNYIYKNLGNFSFEKKNTDWGFNEPSLSNGASIADMDGDGDLDLVINNIDGEAFLFKNTAEGTGQQYLRIRLEGPDQNTFGLGAKIRLEAGEEQWFEQLKVSRGYQSCTEPVAHFGLGTTDRLDRVSVTWHDGKVTELRDVPAGQLLTISYREAVAPVGSPKSKTWFDEKSAGVVAGDWTHSENEHDDYRTQILLPHKMSELGPYMATGDLNGDGRVDLFVGGARNQSGTIFLQDENGRLIPASSQALIADKAYEDVGACIVDADGDGDLDLYVVSGGSEYRPGSGFYQDRLYFNDGKGQFKNSKALPEIDDSGSAVIAADFNSDGQVDFFVAGRQIPEKYPFAPRSFVLIQENGQWVDRTAELAPELVSPGMVTKALVTDLNGDGKNTELVITGEWMPIRVFDFSGGQFEEVTDTYFSQNTTGWWFGLEAGDVDGDGDIDLIGGNLGHNYKFHASSEKPFHVYCDDFDDNGSWDIVLAKNIGKNMVPVRGRQCSSDQMPFIKEKFPTFTAYADAELEDIYGEELEAALHYEAHIFTSGIWENRPEGFVFRPFPEEAQFSVVQDIQLMDLDRDGLPEIVLGGNLYQSERETTRADGSVGLVLKNQGDGNFVALPWTETGWFIPGDVRDIEKIDLERQTCLLVSTNNAPLRAFILNQAIQ